MGLSDEERFQGIVWSLYRFDDILAELKRQRYIPYGDRLIPLIDELWSAFLSKKGNSAYWILGTDQLSSEVTPAQLLGVALLSAKDRIQPDEWEERKRERRDQGKLNALDYIFEFKPEIIKIMSDSYLVPVLKAFFQVEQAFYYLNRYDDKFREGFDELAKVLSKIWGATFRVLEGSAELLSAYCIHQLLDIILPYKDDLVAQWWQMHHIHHAARTGAIEPEEVLNLWKEYQTKRLKIFSEEERILLTLKIIGRRFHYAHQHKELLKMIKDANKKRKKSQRVRLKFIEEALEKCTKAYEKEKKQKRGPRNYRYCWLTDNHWEE